MHPKLKTLVAGLGVLLACSTHAGDVSDAEVVGTMQRSFKTLGIAKLDRLEQTELQKECSTYSGKDLPEALKRRLEEAATSSVKYPSDGKYLGDWKEGEKIAQSGRGFQFNDTAQTEAGGNCYACHELAKAEIAFGNIGPTLHNYGKLRGNSEEIQKYTWARIWNSHAFNACNHMPRFGASGILTEDQIRHVMALLLDPASPVNE